MFRVRVKLSWMVKDFVGLSSCFPALVPCGTPLFFFLLFSFLPSEGTPNIYPLILDFRASRTEKIKLLLSLES